MKTITVPKNIEAEKLLDFDRCPSEQLEEFQMSQEQFNKLWASGLFEEINHICGSMIDDYEDESISSLKLIEEVLILIASRQWGNEVNDSIKIVESLFIKAKEYNTSVYFYF